jgi:hypothetical protein
MGKPGRKPEISARESSKKRKLSADASIILALLRRQPQNREELCRSAKVSKSNFYRVHSFLEKHKIVKKTEGGYVLFFYNQLEKSIENALVRLIEGSSVFSVEELASEVGKPWSEIESVTYTLLKKLGLTIKTRRGEKVIEKSQGGTLLC